MRYTRRLTMKLTTILLAGLFTLGSTITLAERHHDHGKHRDHHKHGPSCSHTVRVNHRVIHQYQSVESSSYRGADYETNYARVISVEPVYRYVSQPVRDNSCIDYDRGRSGYSSHTATVLGAVIGGALGHRIGDSHGDPKVAAVAGGLLGASFGRDIDQRAAYSRGLRVEGPCRVGSHIESRRELVEYKVTYSYNGQVNYARMDYDPGEWVKLDVSYSPA
jgi:uncharacterized protein YcfJ